MLWLTSGLGRKTSYGLPHVARSGTVGRHLSHDESLINSLMRREDQSATPFRLWRVAVHLVAEFVKVGQARALRCSLSQNFDQVNTCCRTPARALATAQQIMTRALLFSAMMRSNIK